MPAISLPDGSKREFEGPVTVLEIARAIGAGLGKAALAGRVNHKLVDCGFRVDQDADVSIVTDRDEEGLEIIRHSTAHLLAQAVKRLFPNAQVTIGPVIEDGFYYDFFFERPFTPVDLQAIEQEMQRIVDEAIAVKRQVLERGRAIAYFKGLGESY
ncbi:MAG: TGS domain-containing protein, partial [Methylococcales bacterium]